MDSRLLSGTVDLLILDVLAHEASYGYEITQQVLGRSSGYFQLTEGSLVSAVEAPDEVGVVKCIGIHMAYSYLSSCQKNQGARKALSHWRIMII